MKYTTILILLLSACFEDSTMKWSGTDTEEGTGSSESSSESGSESSSGSESGLESSSSSSSGSSEESGSSSETTGALPDFALAFDGMGQAVSEAIPEGALAPTFTVELSLLVDEQTRGILIDTRDSVPGTVGWVFYISKDAPYTIQFGYNDVANIGVGLVGPELALGWHHVAVVRKSDGTLTMFVDGEPVTSVDNTAAPVATPVPFRLGRFFDTAYDYWLRGTVDDVRISTAARYTDLFTPELLELDVATALLFRLDEGMGEVTVDEAVGVELQITNAMWVES